MKASLPVTSVFHLMFSSGIIFNSLLIANTPCFFMADKPCTVDLRLYLQYRSTDEAFIGRVLGNIWWRVHSSLRGESIGIDQKHLPLRQRLCHKLSCSCLILSSSVEILLYDWTIVETFGGNRICCSHRSGSFSGDNTASTLWCWVFPIQIRNRCSFWIVIGNILIEFIRHPLLFHICSWLHCQRRTWELCNFSNKLTRWWRIGTLLVRKQKIRWTSLEISSLCTNR